jgi:ferredoxin
VEIVPELIGLDDWGYPLLLVDRVPQNLEPLVRRAADACPTLAISIHELG